MCEEDASFEVDENIDNLILETEQSLQDAVIETNNLISAEDQDKHEALNESLKKTAEKKTDDWGNKLEKQ